MRVSLYVITRTEAETIESLSFDENGIAIVQRIPYELDSPMHIVRAQLSHAAIDWHDFLYSVLADGRSIVSAGRTGPDGAIGSRFAGMVVKAEQSVLEGLEMLVHSIRAGDVPAPQLPLSIEYFDNVLHRVRLVDNPYSYFKLAQAAYACSHVSDYPFSEYHGAFEYWTALDVRGYQDVSDGVEAISVFRVHI